MPRVLNRRDGGDPPGSVYVGRPSKWGNPFIEGEHGTRVQVVEAHRLWFLRGNPLRSQLGELRGRDLVCWCAPLPCHADVLLELANDAWGGQ